MVPQTLEEMIDSHGEKKLFAFFHRSKSSPCFSVPLTDVSNGSSAPSLVMVRLCGWAYNPKMRRLVIEARLAMAWYYLVQYPILEIT